MHSLDTGSPVSIVSLEFIVNALAKLRTEDQTPQKWIALVKKRLEPSTINMWNYGGGPLQFTRQLKAKVSLPGQEVVEGYLQVKSKAPVELLLGSDFLRFMVIKPQTDGIAADFKTKSTRACKSLSSRSLKLSQGPLTHLEQKYVSSKQLGFHLDMPKRSKLRLLIPLGKNN